MSSVADLNELGDLGCQAFERLSRGGETPERKAEPLSVGREGEAPERGRSPRAWAKPPNVGRKGRSPRAWAYTDVDSSNEELELYYLVPKAQYWVRTAADA
jgi:hypothetical protein